MASKDRNQPLNDRVPVVNADGTPSQYLIRLLQDKGLITDKKISRDELNTALAALKLGDLADVDFTAPPEDKQVLTYDAASNSWIAADATGGGGGGGGGDFIAEVIVETTGQTFIEFTGIPQDYRDLELVIQDGGTISDVTLNLILNGDRGTNYGFHRFNRWGNIAQNSISSTGMQLWPCGDRRMFSAGSILFPNYSKTGAKSANGASFNQAGSTLYADERTYNLLGLNWGKTEPIVSIRMECTSGALTAGSTYRLYGKGGGSGSGGSSGGGTPPARWADGLYGLSGGLADITVTTNAAKAGFFDKPNILLTRGNWWWWLGNQADRNVTFEFATSVVLSGFVTFMDLPSNNGGWVPQVSTDGVTYTTVGAEVPWSSVYNCWVFSNNTPYRFYRLQQVSGVTSQDSWQQRFMFKWGST